MTEQELPQKLDLKSMDIVQNRIDELRAIFPEVVTEGKIDFDALKRALGEWVGPNRERFGLNWIGKADCMKIIQQPSIGTLNPDLGESVDFENTNNIFIEGDNLEVLKLLQKSYFGKIKMIYIDPPYNTGNEFIYPDKFSENLDTYLEYSGQKDSQGRKFSTNTDTSGRYHTNWLNMMYPRLYLARNLLKEDGVIFISIDDNEQANLKALCDQIFGEENFLSQVIVQSNKRGQTYKEISKTHEYMLIYTKSENFKLYELEKSADALPFSDELGGYDLWELRNRNPKFGRFNRPNLFYPFYVSELLKDKSGFNKVSLTESDEYPIKIFPRNSEGKDGCWRWGEKTALLALTNIENPSLVARQKRDGGWNIYEKSRKSTTKAKSLWTENEFISEQGTVELGDLGLGAFFDHPKPKHLIKRAGQIGMANDDIVLDFFAGSSSTAHAVMQQNSEDGGSRKFIMVQLPEPCDETSEAYKAGFKTIADISRERIRRAGKKIKEEASSKLDLSGNGEIDVGFKAFKLTNSNFKVWDGNIDNDEAVVRQLELNVHNINDDRNDLDFVFEILLKSGFGLDTKIENIKNLGEHIYGIANNELIICLEKEITKEMIDAIADYDPIQVICLDAGFNGNDQLKTNAVQTFKSKSRSTETEIVFKTV